ncbi:hypothetical protein TNCV_1217901 [Trichonephila clavipes]|nr:hypothetical protein TNCV_1217901 [Trichonephila clavipes]
MCGRFQEDKSRLYGGCSNTFQQKLFKVFWASRETFGPALSWRSGIVCHHLRELLHELFELSSARHRLTPFADRYPNSAYPPQSGTILPRIDPIWAHP